MISIGQIYCDGCQDAFYPDGVPCQDEPNFCSWECEDDYLKQRAADDAYWSSRYGGASVF